MPDNDLRSRNNNNKIRQHGKRVLQFDNRQKSDILVSRVAVEKALCFEAVSLCVLPGVIREVFFELGENDAAPIVRQVC